MATKLVTAGGGWGSEEKEADAIWLYAQSKLRIDSEYRSVVNQYCFPAADTAPRAAI